MRILVSDQNFGDDAQLERRLAAEAGVELVVESCGSGPGTVEPRPNTQAPVHLLPVLEVEAAFHRRVDFTLTYGRVLEDLA